jgi:uncharacterized oxidoreductase
MATVVPHTGTTLRGRTILITGGGSGIGLALAQQLVMRENVVIIVGRDRNKLTAAAQNAPGVIVQTADVGDPESVAALFQALHATQLRPDVLINNAGLYSSWETIVAPHELHSLSAMVRTNVAGPVLMFQAFAQQANQERWNMVVNISSEVAVLPIPPVALYAATKAAVHSFTRSLRVLARGTRFHIVEVFPPVVKTQMTAHQPNAKEAISPHAFASKVIPAIEAGRTELAYGSDALLLSFLARALPKVGIRLVDMLARKQIGVQ